MATRNNLLNRETRLDWKIYLSTSKPHFIHECTKSFTRQTSISRKNSWDWSWNLAPQLPLLIDQIKLAIDQWCNIHNQYKINKTYISRQLGATECLLLISKHINGKRRAAKEVKAMKAWTTTFWRLYCVPSTCISVCITSNPIIRTHSHGFDPRSNQLCANFAQYSPPASAC